MNAITKLDKHYHGLFVFFLPLKMMTFGRRAPHLPRPCVSKRQCGGCMQTTTFIPTFSHSMRHLCDTVNHSVNQGLSIPSFWRTRAYSLKIFWKMRLLAWPSPWMQNTLMIFLSYEWICKMTLLVVSIPDLN